MATGLPINGHANLHNGHVNGTAGINGAADVKPSNTFSVKVGLARMLKGGVIMDVVNAEQVRGMDISISRLAGRSIARLQVLNSYRPESQKRLAHRQ